MKAMILSAGLGTRLRPVTDHFAKPAVPFLGIPLLYYPLSLMAEAGADSFVLNTHYKPEQIENLAQQLPGPRLDVSFSHEPGAPLGSGGGIWRARTLLEGGGSFLVANGDEVILPRETGIMKRFTASHAASRAIASILVMRHPLVGTQFGGVWTDDEDRVKGFGKNPQQFGAGLTGYHYIGLLLLRDRVFDYMKDGESNILYDTLTLAIAQGEEVRACVGNFTWYETGNPTDYIEATGLALDLLANGKGEDHRALESICKRFWHEGTRFQSTPIAKTVIGPGADIDPSAMISGFAVIGDDAQVEAGAFIENSVLLPRAVARKGQQIQGRIWLPFEN